MEKRFRVSIPFLILAVYAAMLTGFVLGGYFAIHDNVRAMEIALN